LSRYHIDYNVVKKPNQVKPLTKEQAAEWLRCATDKYYWMSTYVYIQTEKGRELFIPRPYQKRIVKAAEENRFTINLLGRQSGKTTTLGIDILHDVIFTEDYAVGITSYKLSNVKDYMDRIRFALEHLPFWMKTAVTEYNKSNIRFVNNSSIISQVTGETTFRGITLNRIVSDELAFVKPDISEEFIGSLLPSISAQGEYATTRLNIISTPKGTAGIFPGLWFGAVVETNGFYPVEVKYEEIPGRTPAFETQMVNKIGRDKFDQEYKNKFISSGGTLINSRIMESLPTIKPVVVIENELELFVPPASLQGRTIAMACDVAEGIGEDNHCIQILDIKSFEQIGEWTNNTLSQSDYVKQIIKTIKYLFDNGAEDVYFTFEANGIGAGVARLLENASDSVLDRAYRIDETNEEGKVLRSGHLLTHPKKMKGCGTLKDLIESYRLKINSDKLLTELKFFVKKKNSFEAERGAKDDRVMAMVLMMLLLEELTKYEEEVDDKINELEVEDETWGIVF
jgi:hypothetical protein